MCAHAPEAGRRSEGWADTLDVATVTHTGKPFHLQRSDLLLTFLPSSSSSSSSSSLSASISAENKVAQLVMGVIFISFFFLTPLDVNVWTIRPHSTRANSFQKKLLTKLHNKFSIRINGSSVTFHHVSETHRIYLAQKHVRRYDVTLGRNSFILEIFSSYFIF